MSRKRAKALFAIKALVSLGLLAYVVHAALSRDGVDVLARCAAELDVRWVCAAVALHLASVALGTMRWSLLLRAQGISLPFARLARSYLVGRFIGAFTPSTAGLDVYRAYDVARETGETARSIAVVLVEKLVGLVALALVCASLGPLAPLASFSSALAVSLAAAACAAIGLALFARPALLRPLAIKPSIARLLDTLAERRLDLPTLVRTVVLGVAAHASVAAVFVATGLALGVGASPAALLGTGVAIVVATLLPVSIGGVGVRESVAVVLLASAGVSATEATLVALLGYLTGQAPAIVGAVASMIGAPAPSRPPAAPKLDAGCAAGYPK